MIGFRVFDVGLLVLWLVWFFRLRDDDDDSTDDGPGGGGGPGPTPDDGPSGGGGLRRRCRVTLRASVTEEPKPQAEERHEP